MPRDVHDLERWIEEHPWRAAMDAAGIALLILEVAGILAQLAKRIP
jgi:hypothetical protein